MEKFRVIFTATEMDLLEKILEKNIRSCNEKWPMIYEMFFTLEEMEQMVQVLENAVRSSLDIWLDLAYEQKKAGKTEVTPEMRMQWKYTNRIEELFDRIARLIGKSKRCDDSELLKYL